MRLDPIQASKLLNDRNIDDETLSNFIIKNELIRKGKGTTKKKKGIKSQKETSSNLCPKLLTSHVKQIEKEKGGKLKRTPSLEKLSSTITICFEMEVHGQNFLQNHPHPLHIKCAQT